MSKKDQIVVAIRLNKYENEELYNDVECVADEGWGARSRYLRYLIQVGYKMLKEKELKDEQQMEINKQWLGAGDKRLDRLVVNNKEDKKGDEDKEDSDKRLDRLIELVVELNNRIDKMDNMLLQSGDLQTKANRQEVLEQDNDPYSDKEWIANTMRNFCKVK